MKDWEKLRIENKHILPKPWYNYPVLQNDQEFEKIELLKKQTCWKGSTIKVGMQDGVWTLGYDFLTGCCNPGRKWGEFKSRQDAITYFVHWKLPDLEKLRKEKNRVYSLTNAEINEMREAMLALLNPQLELFQF